MINKRYIVRDKDGAYHNAYNFHFGKQNAYDWAVQCAKLINGIVYFSGEDNKEQEVYRAPDSKK